MYKILPSIDVDTLSSDETEYVNAALSISEPLKAIETVPSSANSVSD